MSSAYGIHIRLKKRDQDIKIQLSMKTDNLEEIQRASTEKIYSVTT